MAEGYWFRPSEAPFEENVFKVGAYERVFDRVAVVVKSLHHVLSPTSAEPKSPTKENLVVLNEALEDVRVKSLELKSHLWLWLRKINVTNPRIKHIRSTQSCVYLKVIDVLLLLVEGISMLLRVHPLVSDHASHLEAFWFANAVPLRAIGVASEAVLTWVFVKLGSTVLAGNQTRLHRPLLIPAIFRFELRRLLRKYSLPLQQWGWAVLQAERLLALATLEISPLVSLCLQAHIGGLLPLAEHLLKLLKDLFLCQMLLLWVIRRLDSTHPKAIAS